MLCFGASSSGLGGLKGFRGGGGFRVQGLGLRAEFKVSGFGDKGAGFRN